MSGKQGKTHLHRGCCALLVVAEALLPPRGLKHAVPFVVTIHPGVIVTAKEAESIVQLCNASNT